MCNLRGSIKETYKWDLIFFLPDFFTLNFTCQAVFGLMGRSKEKKKLACVLVPDSIVPSEELVVKVSIDVPYT